MSQKSEKAALAVAELFAATPGVAMDDLYAAALTADKRLSGIGRRSFNATYVLPLKRAATKRTAKHAAPKRRARKSQRSATNKGAVTRKVTRHRGVRLSDSARAEARRLVLERDQLVLSNLRSGSDPRGAYELAAKIDRYVERLARALRK